MANILQQYISGPADVFVGTGALGVLECLGFCERDVGITIRLPKRPVRTSITGDAMYDRQFMGKEIEVSIRNLNLYDEEILAKLLALAAPGAGNQLANAGLIAANSIGTLERQEGFSPRCLIRTRYGRDQSGEHAAFRRMIPIFNIPHVQIVNQISVPLGTAPERQWTATLAGVPAWNPADGSAIVWNFDDTGIPSNFTFMQPGDTPAPTT